MSDIEKLIEAGEKATQGEWEFIEPEFDFSDAAGYGIPPLEKESEVIIPEDFCDDGNDWLDTLSVMKKANAAFIVRCANSRPAIKALYEENKRLRELLKQGGHAVRRLFNNANPEIWDAINNEGEIHAELVAFMDAEKALRGDAMLAAEKERFGDE